mmetsp:Transcript_129023/g.346065  ORF Transcript_129023/g.346065 Transcript_129023/m.346065 type:complete len:239 (-) Transcript_129023:73-789(-)
MDLVIGIEEGILAKRSMLDCLLEFGVLVLRRADAEVQGGVPGLERLHDVLLSLYRLAHPLEFEPLGGTCYALLLERIRSTPQYITGFVDSLLCLLLLNPTLPDHLLGLVMGCGLGNPAALCVPQRVFCSLELRGLVVHLTVRRKDIGRSDFLRVRKEPDQVVVRLLQGCLCSLHVRPLGGDVFLHSLQGFLRLLLRRGGAACLRNGSGQRRLCLLSIFFVLLYQLLLLLKICERIVSR